MNTLLIILYILSVVALVIISGVQLRPSGFSDFELQRRARLDKAMKRLRTRDQLLPGIRSILMLKATIVLVIIAWLAVAAFGWLWGVVATLAVVVLFRPLSRLGAVRRLSLYIYAPCEPWLLRKTRLLKWAERLLGSRLKEHQRIFHSREELAHTIEQSGDILSIDEKKLLSGALAFRDKMVHQVMTPKKDMKTVSASEFLGPLVLSELHQGGHSRLPVIAKDLNHVVGILYLQDMLSLTTKKSVTAEKAMDPKVHYVSRNDSLQTALGIFLKSHHHLCIVLGDEGQTVGLVTIEDVLEALIGRTIKDEDDPAPEH